MLTYRFLFLGLAFLWQIVLRRPDNITYKKNEVFLDCIEKVNLLVSATGALLRSEIQGRLNVKAYLSGMPELRLGLNDKIQFGALDKGALSYLVCCVLVCCVPVLWLFFFPLRSNPISSA